jgi:hypothetical protein
MPTTCEQTTIRITDIENPENITTINGRLSIDEICELAKILKINRVGIEELKDGTILKNPIIICPNNTLEQ